MRSTQGEKSVRVLLYGLLGIIAASTLYPFWHVIMYALSDSKQAMTGGFFLWPRAITLDAFHLLSKTGHVFVTYRNTILRTVIGTLFNLAMTASIAYPLSRRRFIGRNFLTLAIFFTMLFSGGMIPSFLLIRSLGLLNSFWSMIFPTAISAYNMFIMRNYFQSLPDSLEESASLDGASPLCTLIRIILPCSAPVIAALGMFYGIGHWNAYFDCVLYINDINKQVLQAYLRTLITGSAYGAMSSAEDRALSTGLTEETMRMAAISASVIPVLLIYPWLQKYYVKGVMIGSVKG